MSETITLPNVLTMAGLQPTPPTTIRSNLLASVAAVVPDYTVLPGGLIEDISSTEVASITQCEQAMIDAVNSITPYGANPFILNQLGQIYGVPQGQASNTSVSVVFSGPAGFPLPPGFTVSDGANQYLVQDGAVIGQGGLSLPVYVLAAVQGSWVVPAGTVNTIITYLPPGVTLTVTNPLPGTPGGPAQTESDYRAQVLQAGLASAQGMPRFLKTLLVQIPGVLPRLVAVQQQTSGGWKVLCGGGDPYAVANAIFLALFDITALVGSTTAGRNAVVAISDYPDTYQVTFVVPPAQTVALSVTWNTTAGSFVSGAAVSQLGGAALAAYINALPVGVPMNLFELQDAFIQAISTIILPQFLTRLVFGVFINGNPVAVEAGTSIIAGDSESYFQTTIAQINIAQG